MVAAPPDDTYIGTYTVDPEIRYTTPEQEYGMNQSTLDDITLHGTVPQVLSVVNGEVIEMEVN